MTAALTITTPRRKPPAAAAPLARTMPILPPALEAKGVAIRRGRKLVLRHVYLTLYPGEIVALHGANGAGKTTLLQCLAGILRPVNGTIVWPGFGATHVGDTRRAIGYLGHENGLYAALTAWENLVFAGRLYGLDEPERHATAMLACAGLSRHARERVSWLSRGMRQRLAIGRALLHRPALLLLDEPFTSLDAAGRDWLVELLREYQASGGAVVLATHEADAPKGLPAQPLHVSGGTVRRTPLASTVSHGPSRFEPRADSGKVGSEPSRFLGALRAFGWLMAKDLTMESRCRRVWPSMLLLGLSLVLLIEMQIELPAALKEQVVGGMLWLGVLFAGVLALERSFAAEREEGCWRALLRYPVSPTVVYLAKVAVNVLALALLECLVIFAFTVLSNVPLMDRGMRLAGIALLTNVCLTSVGVLVSAATNTVATRNGVLALVLLPLATPVVIAAASATRLALAGELATRGGLWMQLLSIAAVAFTTLGIMVFEYAVEE